MSIYTNTKKKLYDQILYVIGKSNFYQNKYKDKITNEEILSSFQHLPFTTKTELLQDQAMNPPYGSNLCVEVKDIQRIHKTSGTTNKPLILALTNKDIERTISVGAKCFSRAGLTPNDTVIHCLNYNMWAGGFTDHQSLEKTGAGVIPFGVGNTERLIETILFLKPTAIHCTPSYLAKIELLLKTVFKLKPIELNLRLGLFGAESGLQNPDFRNSIETKWGIRAMNANYGLSDVLSMIGSECIYSKHLHFSGLNILYPELMNPITKELVNIEDGAVGELVLSNLQKEAQPLVRYRTNDIIKIISTTKCKCGDDTFQFDIVGRTDDMIVIKGVNVFVSSIDTIINKNYEFLTGHYQFFISKSDPIDKCILKAELRILDTYIEVKNKLLEEFRRKLSISPEIIFVNEGVLPRTEGKTRKLFRTL